MLDERKDYFLFTVNCYIKSGLRQSSSPLRKFISIYILLPLLIVLYGMVIINFRYKNNNIFEIAEVFESVSTFGQLVARKLIVLIHGPLFEDIIADRAHFWHYDLFGKEKGDHYRSKIAFCVFLIKSLWFASSFSVIFHFCTPFFVENAVLPDACWIPIDSKIVIIFLYTLEIILYLEVIYLLGVFDAFFLCMCADLKIQFQLLNESVRSIKIEINCTRFDEENCLKTLKKCFIHHNFILRVHKKLNRIFSEYFVCQYLINVGGVCIQFFIINSETSNLTQILRSIVYILIASLLGALIFIPSSTIEDEAEVFENEIYNIYWQNTGNLKIRKFVNFWLMRAQIPIAMKGAGLFQVNRNVLIQIPRLAFSFATVLSRSKEIV